MLEFVTSLLTYLNQYLSAISAIFALLAFGWPIFQFFSTRKREAENRQFELFHKLVKELVEPDAPDIPKRIDRQAAVIFELRHFKRYYEFTLRLLGGLSKT